MTHLFEGALLMGWVLIVVGAISLIRWWLDIRKYRTRARPRPGGKVGLAVEWAGLALPWLIGGALLVYPVAPVVSIVMVVVAAYCFPVIFVGIGLFAVFRVDDFMVWMGQPQPEERWRRGIVRGVGVVHALAGLSIAVFGTCALLSAAIDA